uniref:Uncharacterized protein n=1 Tax=Anguilla anguilla TaxID=7936 RepID=A0A0E9R7Y7_ANGAN
MTKHGFSKPINLLYLCDMQMSLTKLLGLTNFTSKLGIFLKQYKFKPIFQNVSKCFI